MLPEGAIGLPVRDVLTVFCLKGRRGGRTGLHHGGRQRKQQDPGVPVGRNLPEGIRLLGFNGRGVQGARGSGGDAQRQHPRLRQGEPQGPDLLVQHR